MAMLTLPAFFRLLLASSTGRHDIYNNDTQRKTLYDDTECCGDYFHL